MKGLEELRQAPDLPQLLRRYAEGIPVCLASGEPDVGTLRRAFLQRRRSLGGDAPADIDGSGAIRSIYFDPGVDADAILDGLDGATDIPEARRVALEGLFLVRAEFLRLQGDLQVASALRQAIEAELRRWLAGERPALLKEPSLLQRRRMRRRYPDLYASCVDPGSSRCWRGIRRRPTIISMKRGWKMAGWILFWMLLWLAWTILRGFLAR